MGGPRTEDRAIVIHPESHVDHGLTRAQLDWLLARFRGRDAFFVETVELPAELGTVPCGLYGPAMGDPPVPEEETVLRARGSREWPSRILIGAGPRPTRDVTVVAGPHGGEPCVLYTAFGGPQAPQEPGDPRCPDKAASEAFWAAHALAG